MYYFGMSLVLDQIESQIPYDCFGENEAQTIFKGTAHSRYSFFKRAVAAKELIHLRRGLYLLSEKNRRHSLNLFVIAQKIYGPSYISFESALSQHGWIPEAVFGISSAGLKRSKTFKTPVGIFSYQKVVADPFFVQVEAVSTEEGNYYLSSPWRALADYVYIHKKDWKGLHPLIHSLRIDEENFAESKKEDLEELLQIYSHYGVRRFLKGVMKELK